MELRVDGQPGDLGSVPASVWRWSAESLCSAEATRSGRQIQLRLPATESNDRIFGYARTPHTAERFNRSLHRAQLLEGGVELFTGVIRLLGVRPEVADEAYEVELRGGAAGWVETAARSTLEELPVEFSMSLIPTAIRESWEGDSPVRFLPLIHDDYQAPASASSLLPVERLLSVDDYHPFLHVGTLVEQIFAQEGYTLRSDFIHSEPFDRLYISGAYATRDVEARRRRFDFLARRGRAVEAVADSSGRVYASAYMAVNSVGNLVDCLSPQAEDDQGTPQIDCFSTGGALRIEDEALTFRPSSELEVGFSYHLRYESDYRILSRTQLAGFDSVYLGEGADFRFRLANRFEDRRSETVAGQAYRIVVFGHNAGARYRLLTDKDTLPFASRSALLTLTSDETPILQIYNATTALWSPYSGDWALYDGYITEEGTTEVELTLRTAPEQVGPQQPKRFTNIYFSGADEGMSFRLLKGCSLQPIFSSQPAFGEELTWRDVAQLGVRQTELLDALQHLFNWRIFTDEAQKCVVIEPQEALYGQSEVVDWSHRVVMGEEIFLQESDREQHASRRYAYRAGDGTVERYNLETGERFGEWVVVSPSMATLQGEEQRRNPLFAATQNRTGYFELAPSASVPVVGDRDDVEAVDGRTFLPRILYYAGLKSLPEGERWGYPAPEGVYPSAFFHPINEAEREAGITLCFEDREGLVGLNQYHRAEEAILSRGQRLHLTLLLAPDEVAALGSRSTPSEAGFDALFRLRVGGEPLRCRLEAVESYNPQRGLARCRFICLNDDRP